MLSVLIWGRRQDAGVGLDQNPLTSLGSEGRGIGLLEDGHENLKSAGCRRTTFVVNLKANGESPLAGDGVWSQIAWRIPEFEIDVTAVDLALRRRLFIPVLTINHDRN